MIYKRAIVRCPRPAAPGGRREPMAAVVHPSRRIASLALREREDAVVERIHRVLRRGGVAQRLARKGLDDAKGVLHAMAELERQSILLRPAHCRGLLSPEGLRAGRISACSAVDAKELRGQSGSDKRSYVNCVHQWPWDGGRIATDADIADRLRCETRRARRGLPVSSTAAGCSTTTPGAVRTRAGQHGFVEAVEPHQPQHPPRPCPSPTAPIDGVVGEDVAAGGRRPRRRWRRPTMRLRAVPRWWTRLTTSWPT